MENYAQTIDSNFLRAYYDRGLVWTYAGHPLITTVAHQLLDKLEAWLLTSVDHSHLALLRGKDSVGNIRLGALFGKFTSDDDAILLKMTWEGKL